MSRHTTPISLCKKLVALTLRRHSDLSPIASARPMSFWRTPVQYLKFLVTPFTQSEREGVANYLAFQAKGNGYLLLQSTRPQTLGYTRGLARRDVGMDIRGARAVVRLLPLDRRRRCAPNSERRFCGRFFLRRLVG